MNLRYVVFSVFLASSVCRAAPAGWQTYNDMSGNYRISYPASWQVMTKGNALVISSPGEAGERGVFGITPRPAGTTIEESIEKEFSYPDRPKDLQKVPSKIAGYPATKVWGSKKGDPNTRVVEYYVQVKNQQFYILFQGPQGASAAFTPIFNGMINSLQFSK